MSMSVRRERPPDVDAVRHVVASAFGRPEEAVLVDVLRAEVPDAISLVAEVDGRIVGHIFFAPVTLEPALPGIRIAGLAPLAVSPPFQRKGVGSALVYEGLQSCRARCFHAVVVLGHPEYYARFGFVPAHEEGLKCEFPADPEVYRVLAFSPVFTGQSTVVRYPRAFHGVGAQSG